MPDDVFATGTDVMHTAMHSEIEERDSCLVHRGGTSDGDPPIIPCGIMCTADERDRVIRGKFMHGSSLFYILM